MDLTTRDGCTVLTGAVVDQSALHGLLNRLRDSGLTLVSVTRVGDDMTPPDHPDTTSTGA